MARWSASSDPTAPARPRSSTSSAGSSAPDSGTLAFEGTPAATAPAARPGQARDRPDVPGRRARAPGLTVLENVMLGAERRREGRLRLGLLGLWRSSREERRVGARATQVLDELGAPSSPIVCRRRCPTGSRSGRRWPAPSSPNHRSSCWTSRPAGSPRRDGRARAADPRAPAQRMGVLLVEHHMDLVMSMCDRMVVLNFGRVIAARDPRRGPGEP